DAAETAVVAPSCVSTSKRYAAPGVSPVMTTSRAEPAAVVPLPPSGRTTYRSAPEDAPVHATRTVPSSSAVALTPPAGVAGSGAAGGQSAVRTVVLATPSTPPPWWAVTVTVAVRSQVRPVSVVLVAPPPAVTATPSEEATVYEDGRSSGAVQATRTSPLPSRVAVTSDGAGSRGQSAVRTVVAAEPCVPAVCWAVTVTLSVRSHATPVSTAVVAPPPAVTLLPSEAVTR